MTEASTMRRPRPRPQAEAPDPEPVDQEVSETEDDEQTSPNDLVLGGWCQAQRNQDATSSYAQALKPDETMQFVKFLDEAPYANYLRHWVERTGENGKFKRPYTCLQTVNKRCPLCDIGDKPQAVSSFNVALIGDEGQVDLKSWDVTGKVFAAVKNFAQDNRIGPLTKGYFGVNKTKGNRSGTTQTNVVPVGAAAAREDYSLILPDADTLAAIKKYDKGILDIPKVATLQEIADEMANDD